MTSWEDDEPYPNATALFQANVDRATKGKRGQALLKEIEAALLAMPEKRLSRHIVCQGGEVCMLGAMAVERAVRAGKGRAEAMAELEAQAKKWGQYDKDDEDWDESDDETFVYLKDLLDIHSESLAWMLVYQNDEGAWDARTPEQLWERMLKWVQARIVRERGSR